MTQKEASSAGSLPVHIVGPQCASNTANTARIELGFSRRLPQGTRMSAGCGKHWLNLCGARQG